MDIQSFGNRLLEIRQTKKLTQEELASKLGVTPQAISKWERGAGLPDIELLCEIGKLLDVTLDSLLGITKNKVTESGDIKERDELMQIILADEVVLRIGEGMVDLFTKDHADGFKIIQEIRKQLAAEYGYLLPVVRIMDTKLCEDNEYQVVIYDRIMFSQHITNISEFDVSEVFKNLKAICIENYSLLLNRQIVKNLIDNLKVKYPAAVEGIVPEKITYADIQHVLCSVIDNKKSIHNLLKIIEMLEDKLTIGKDIKTIGTEIAEIK